MKRRSARVLRVLAAAAWLSAQAAPGAAKAYSDPVFPFSIDVPQDWDAASDRCEAGETAAVGIVHRVTFLKRYSMPAPVAMLKVTFYSRPSRLTPNLAAAQRGPNLELVDLGGLKWVRQVYGSSRRTICMSPQVAGLLARLCPLGLEHANMLDMGPQELALMGKSEAAVQAALASFRWRGPAPDASRLPVLCPGRPPAFRSDLSGDQAEAQARRLIAELRRCSSWSLSDPAKGDCSAFKTRKDVEALTALGPPIAATLLQALREDAGPGVGISYDLGTALCVIGPEAPGLARELRPLLKDRRLHVRDVAAKTLRCIGPPGPR